MLNENGLANASWARRASLAVILALSVVGPSDAATSPAVEPGALQRLQAATAYLQAQPTLAFSADIVWDDVQRSGLKYQVRASAQFEEQRPGQLFVGYNGDRRRASFYVDGKTFVFYDRSANVYGTAPATDDIDATFDTIFAKYDFTVPLLDLVSNHPGESFTGKLRSGYDLGPSSIGGFATHHLLFTQSDIDWQIWIDDGSAPLVRALSITYKQLPGQPEYTAVLSDWKFTPIAASVFSFSPPKGAIPVDLVAVSKATNSSK